MWYGKISIILYVFSLAMLFGSYYINQIFNDPVVSQSATYTSLQTIMGTFGTPSASSINVSLIFGDFMSVFTLIASLMSGSVFSSSMTVLGNSGFADLSVGLFMGLLFDSATLFLVLYIISNRSL